MKQRHKPSSLSAAKVISIGDVLDWKIPAGHTKSDEDAIPPREPKLYTVTGFVRLVKQSDDDCDFHLEIAPSGDSTKDWMIVEVSANSAAVQNKLAGMFDLSDHRKSHKFNGDRAKKIKVTGYAFIDLSHQCSRWPTKGCQHGSANVMTIWELHPIFAIDFEQ